MILQSNLYRHTIVKSFYPSKAGLKNAGRTAFNNILASAFEVSVLDRRRSLAVGNKGIARHGTARGTVWLNDDEPHGHGRKVKLVKLVKQV